MNYPALPIPDTCQLRQGTIAKPPGMETATAATAAVRRYHPYDAARLRAVGSKVEPGKLPHLNSFPAVLPNTTAAPEMMARLPWAVQSVSIPSCGSYKIIKQQKVKTDTNQTTGQSVTKTLTSINHQLVLPDGQTNLNQQVNTRYALYTYCTCYCVSLF